MNGGWPFIRSLRAAAKAAGISASPTIYGTRRHSVYDRAVWIDALGKSRALSQGHLLRGFGFKESDKFHPGDDIAPLVKSGDNQFGTMICYDLRFPEMARMLTLQGANVLVAPSGWVQGDLKVEHWQTMIKARALENGCYVIAPGQVGNIYIGHSMAVDPLGRTLVDLGEKEDLAIVEIDLNLVRDTAKNCRAAKPRTEVYARHAPISSCLKPSHRIKGSPTSSFRLVLPSFVSTTCLTPCHN